MSTNQPATSKIRALRGATTATANSAPAIEDATRELLEQLLEDNDLAPERLVSLIFTATPDLNAAFPAAAARSLGLDGVPLLCAQEMDVPGAPSHCIRVLLHVEVEHDYAELRPVYLRGAVALRSDLG
jgi:chorismate mutase